MGEEIIRMLEFPRRLARGAVDLQQCPHAGNYLEGDSRCQACRTFLECEWLHHSDEFSALGERPLEDVVEALNVACMYVDAQVTLSGHDTTSCGCDACRWVQRAWEMLEGCQDGTLWGRTTPTR